LFRGDGLQVIEGEGVSNEDGKVLIIWYVKGDIEQNREEMIKGAVIRHRLQLSNEAVAVVFIVALKMFDLVDVNAAPAQTHKLVPFEGLLLLGARLVGLILLSRQLR
jgi:hypothetical protein